MKVLRVRVASSDSPQLPEQSERCFLFFPATDRASKWVYFEIRDDRKAATARSFVSNLIRRAPFRLTHLLTDNEVAFTDRLNRPQGQPSGKHPWTRCAPTRASTNRLIPPRQPQTNVLVERFNGRISEALASVHLRNREELEATLERYRRLYNGQVPQKNLDARTPEILKAYYESNPERFRRKPHDPPNPDKSSAATMDTMLLPIPPLFPSLKRIFFGILASSLGVVVWVNQDRASEKCFSLGPFPRPFVMRMDSLAGFVSVGPRRVVAAWGITAIAHGICWLDFLF